MYKYNEGEDQNTNIKEKKDKSPSRTKYQEKMLPKLLKPIYYLKSSDFSISDCKKVNIDKKKEDSESYFNIKDEFTYSTSHHDIFDPEFSSCMSRVTYANQDLNKEILTMKNSRLNSQISEGKINNQVYDVNKYYCNETSNFSSIEDIAEKNFQEKIPLDELYKPNLKYNSDTKKETQNNKDRNLEEKCNIMGDSEINNNYIDINLQTLNMALDNIQLKLKSTELSNTGNNQEKNTKEKNLIFENGDCEEEENMQILEIKNKISKDTKNIFKNIKTDEILQPKFTDYNHLRISHVKTS